VPGDGASGAAPDAGRLTPLTAAAHVFVGDLAAPALYDEDHHHLARVLRLPPGTGVTVGDGDGRWRPGRLTGGISVDVVGDIVVDPEPAPAVTVAFALTKGDRPELTIQKLTEVGVDRIAPFVADRSVVRWDDAKVARQAERWASIARNAAMQCRRTRLPAIDALTAFADAAALPGATLADLDGEPPSLARTTLLVGPEGGWSEREIGCSLPRTRLGVHVFRAETAAITGGALLIALREILTGYRT
jgi:16S rRNA (uracil1498-N3)-methyltransferase